MKSSLVVLAGKNERELGRCIRSARPFVDEVIVVGKESSDGIMAVARGQGAICRAWDGPEDFAAARNFAFGIAQHPWVLTLESYEWIDEFLAAEIRSARTRVDCVAYSVGTRPGTPLGSATLDIRARKLVLFKTDKRIRFEGKIHDDAIESLSVFGGSLGRFESSLQGESPFDVLSLEFSSGYRLAVQGAEADPGSAKVQYVAGCYVLAKGHPLEAINYFQKAAACSRRPYFGILALIKLSALAWNWGDLSGQEFLAKAVVLLKERLSDWEVASAKGLLEYLEQLLSDGKSLMATREDVLAQAAAFLP